jgi:hypothetical protein
MNLRTPQSELCQKPLLYMNVNSYPEASQTKCEKTQNFSPLSLVSLTPVIALYFRISPRIFVRIRNGPNGTLRGPGETNSRKKPEVENLVSDSFKLLAKKSVSQAFQYRTRNSHEKYCFS